MFNREDDSVLLPSGSLVRLTAMMPSLNVCSMQTLNTRQVSSPRCRGGG